MKEMNVPVEEHEQRYEDDDDDDEGSFIEISLDAKPRWENADNIFQFRLSFSTMLLRNSDSGGSFRSKLLMSAESVKSTSSQSCTLSYDSSSSISSSSSSAVLNRSNARRNYSGMTFPTPEQIKSSDTTHLTENKWRKVVQFLAVQRMVKLLLLNIRSSTENTKLYDTTKKRTKVREVISNGVMNLIVKFRTLKSKSRNTQTRASNHISCPRHKCYYECPVIEPISITEGKRVNKSNLPQVSKNSIKGMINNLTVSCSASIKSSPVDINYCTTETESTVKAYTRENSIQAAIAHCKMSLDLI